MDLFKNNPKFTNHCFATCANLGSDAIGQIHAALLALHESEEGSQTFGYLKSKNFIAADISEWMGYVELLKSGIDIGG